MYLYIVFLFKNKTLALENDIIWEYFELWSEGENMDLVLLFSLGVIAGTIGSLVGLGGGIIIVPSLLYLQSLDILNYSLEHQDIVGISLMAIIFTALSSTISNYKNKRVDIKSGLIFFIGVGPAVILGSIASEHIDERQFYILFGLLMLLTTYLLTIKDKIKPVNLKWNVIRHYESNGIQYEYGYNIYFGIIISGVAGFLAGLFGIGGGSILVPMMIILFKFPVHVATATSMFIILMSSSVGSVSHILLGNIIISYVIFIGIGAYIGGKIGPFISSKVSSSSLISILRVVIIIIAIQMIFKGV